MTDVIEYVRRSTLNMTNFNTAYVKGKVDLDYITSSRMTLAPQFQTRANRNWSYIIDTFSGCIKLQQLFLQFFMLYSVLHLRCPSLFSLSSMFVAGNTTGEIISRGSHFTLSKCSLLFTTETCTRDKIACGRNTIQIQVGKNFEGSDLKLRIQLGPIVSTDAVWKDHDLPVIEVSQQSTIKIKRLGL